MNNSDEPKAVRSTASATRAKILDTAIELLSTEGRGSLTTRNITSKTGIQAPALYRAFGSMEKLREVAFQEMIKRHLSSVVSVAGADATASLHDLWERSVAFGSRYPEEFLDMARPDSVQFVFDELFDKILANLCQLHREQRLNGSPVFCFFLTWGSILSAISLITTYEECTNPEFIVDYRKVSLDSVLTREMEFEPIPAAVSVLKRAAQSRLALSEDDKQQLLDLRGRLSTQVFNARFGLD